MCIKNLKKYTALNILIPTLDIHPKKVIRHVYKILFTKMFAMAYNLSYPQIRADWVNNSHVMK